MSESLDELRDVIRQNGMLDYHLALLKSPKLTDEAKLMVVSVWEEIFPKPEGRPQNPETLKDKGESV